MIALLILLAADAEIDLATEAGARRGPGRLSFGWYRVRVTVPERVGDFPTAGSAVAFETAVDDAAEVWVDGQLPRAVGEAGGAQLAGFNAPNRVLLQREAEPGRAVQIAVFAVNGPLSVAPENRLWMRLARLRFHRGEPPVRAVRLELRDLRFNALVPPDLIVEPVASGLTWTEGPVWSEREDALYFSAIPANRVWMWREGGGGRVALEPSGFGGAPPFLGAEPGSNGLAFDPLGRLVLCQHGDRRIARATGEGGFETVVDWFEGMRLNSPNDLLFTDPPFGLPSDATRELDFCGVYRLGRDGRLALLARELAAPNGIALSPDERTLYVSNAAPTRPVVMAYDFDGATVTNGRVFFDAARFVRTRPGMPDGMKTDAQGNLYVCGPGGLYVFTPDGTHLGTVDLGVATSNCAFGRNGLYVTAGATVYRFRGLRR